MFLWGPAAVSLWWEDSGLPCKHHSSLSPEVLKIQEQETQGPSSLFALWTKNISATQPLTSRAELFFYQSLASTCSHTAQLGCQVWTSISCCTAGLATTHNELHCTHQLNSPKAWGRVSFCKYAGHLGVLSGPQVSLKSTKAVSRVTILTQLVVLLYLTAGRERATHPCLPRVLQLNT